MTLDQMCQQAARLSDRYDEFEKVDKKYEDEALHYFNVFRDAINEAYRAAARDYVKPDVYAEVVVGEDGLVDLSELDPLPQHIKNVLDATRTKAVVYAFRTKFELWVQAPEGTTVLLYYNYLPDALTGYSDEPIFPESVVDPMVYISLAVSRIWKSEKKMQLADSWMAEHYKLLRELKTDMRGAGRRIPRRTWR